VEGGVEIESASKVEEEVPFVTRKESGLNIDHHREQRGIINIEMQDLNLLLRPLLLRM